MEMNVGKGTTFPKGLYETLNNFGFPSTIQKEVHSCPCSRDTRLKLCVV
jgi:hypothetical protein